MDRSGYPGASRMTTQATTARARPASACRARAMTASMTWSGTSGDLGPGAGASGCLVIDRFGLFVVPSSVLTRFGFRRMDMLRTNTDPDQQSRNSAQNRENIE